MKGLTTFGRSVATASATLLILGLAFGSFPYLLCALLLGGAAFAARGLHAPRLDVSRATSATDVRAGDVVEVVVEARNDGGACAVSIEDRAPDAFLLQGGTNFDVAWLPRGERATLGFDVVAPRRGTHKLGPLRATTYDPLFLQSSVVADLGEPTDVVVHPKTPAAPRIRTTTAWGRSLLPGGDKAHRGVQTNDFRELRPYEKGDPLRQVNWKATARQSRDDLHLIVNDYEVEGKKAVWLFCDASPYTVGGTTTESAFDELANASLAVAGHYLDLGHRVGFTLYGAGPARIIYPDAGDLQERRIAGLLAAAEPGPQVRTYDNAQKAVEATKGFLAREKPVVFCFTLAGRDSSLGPALATARALATPGRRPAPVALATPIVDEENAGTLAGRLVALREKAQLKGMERRGITVIRYHPQRAPLMAMLAKGVLR